MAREQGLRRCLGSQRAAENTPHRTDAMKQGTPFFLGPPSEQLEDDVMKRARLSASAACCAPIAWHRFLRKVG